MTSSSTDTGTLAAHEFAALRHTIATRGTARMVLAPAIVVAWATLALVQLAYTPLPLATVVSLVALAVGFEAVNALHVGVERIGRYLQVFYEEAGTASAGVPLLPEAPAWERTAMASGPRLPGGEVDPLFTVLFLGAALINMAIGLIPWPTATEAAIIGALHLLVLARVARARLAAAKQRAHDLAYYRNARDRQV